MSVRLLYLDRRLQHGVRQQSPKTKEDFATRTCKDLFETFNRAGGTQGECLDMFSEAVHIFLSVKRVLFRSTVYIIIVNFKRTVYCM